MLGHLHFARFVGKWDGHPLLARSSLKHGCCLSPRGGGGENCLAHKHHPTKRAAHSGSKYSKKTTERTKEPNNTPATWFTLEAPWTLSRALRRAKGKRSAQRSAQRSAGSHWGRRKDFAPVFAPWPASRGFERCRSRLPWVCSFFLLFVGGGGGVEGSCCPM